MFMLCICILTFLMVKVVQNGWVFRGFCLRPRDVKTVFSSRREPVFQGSWDVRFPGKNLIGKCTVQKYVVV